MGTPREILARIVPGDPLGLAALVSARLRAEALLLDADRVLLCSFARVAREAPGWRGRPSLERWLGARVDEAIADARDELGHPDSEQPPVFDALATPLGLDPSRLRAGCHAFNRLAPSVREAFLQLVLERRSLDRLARAAGLSASLLARRARVALDVLRNHVGTRPSARDRSAVGGSGV